MECMTGNSDAGANAADGGSPERRGSPAFVRHWTHSRQRAIDLVRESLETGSLVRCTAMPCVQRDRLARVLAELSRNSATFGEPELGRHAARLADGLRTNTAVEMREALAFELLVIADHPVDRRAPRPGKGGR